MYKNIGFGHQKLNIPIEIELRTCNRWVKLANLKYIIILLMVLMLVTGCTNTQANYHTGGDDAFSFGYYPIEYVLEPITASGYLEIFASRYIESPPSASFHPYPEYFHLFPFAMVESVPVFALTNSVDEIFDMLYLNQEDLPTDRFGNIRLDNVAAVFDNFTTQFIVTPELGFVFAEVIEFVDDWDGAYWQQRDSDFILFTNGDKSLEPVEVRVGEEILGFSLTRIESSNVYFRDGEVYNQLSAEAEVSGTIEPVVDIIFRLDFDSEYRVVADLIVSSDFLSLVPAISDFNKEFGHIQITNSYEMMYAMGVTRSELDAAGTIEFTGKTVVLDLFWVSSFGYVANFVELVG